MDEPEVVELKIPAHSAYARVARLSAARLARRRAFTYREVEDLRTAIDESLVALLGPSEATSSVDIVFSLQPDALEITLTGPNAAEVGSDERFETLVTDLVDESAIDTKAGRIRLLKRHTPTEDERPVGPLRPGTDPDERGPLHSGF